MREKIREILREHGLLSILSDTPDHEDIAISQILALFLDSLPGEKGVKQVNMDCGIYISRTASDRGYNECLEDIRRIYEI